MGDYAFEGAMLSFLISLFVAILPLLPLIVGVLVLLAAIGTVWEWLSGSGRDNGGMLRKATMPRKSDTQATSFERGGAG